MNNINIKNLKIVKSDALCIDPAFYTENLNRKYKITSNKKINPIEFASTSSLEKAIDYLETQIDNPDSWVSWEEAKKRLSDVTK